MLLGMSGMAQPKKSNSKFQLKGEFISQKNVHYEIYQVKSDGNLFLINDQNGKIKYEVKLKLGELYVIKFMPVEGSIKYLFVQAFTAGTLELDVDFGTDTSARLIYANAEYTIYNADPKKVLANL